MLKQKIQLKLLFLFLIESVNSENLKKVSIIKNKNIYKIFGHKNDFLHILKTEYENNSAIYNNNGNIYSFAKNIGKKILNNIGKITILSFFTWSGIWLVSSFRNISRNSKDIEKDYFTLPETIELNWITKELDDFFKIFGFNLDFENNVGIIFRGYKSENYRSKQYAKKLISEEISNNLLKDHDDYYIKNELKNEFLDKVFFQDMILDTKTNEIKFFLNISEASVKLRDALNKMSKYSFERTEFFNILSGNFILTDTMKGKKIYSLLVPNNGIRVLDNDSKHITKCPIMSWEYDMLSYINIKNKERLEKDRTFNKNLSNSLESFYDFALNLLEIAEDKTCEDSYLLGYVLKGDPGIFNKKSLKLSECFKKILKSSKKYTDNNLNIEEMSKLVINIGNAFHKLIINYNKSENVFKHCNVPLFIQKSIHDFNEINEDKYYLPNINLNFPFVSENFWTVLDPNDQNQNLQIAVILGHFENRYYFFTKQERDEFIKKILSILKKYINKEQFEYVKKNIITKEFSY